MKNYSDNFFSTNLSVLSANADSSGMRSSAFNIFSFRLRNFLYFLDFGRRNESISSWNSSTTFLVLGYSEKQQ